MLFRGHTSLPKHPGFDRTISQMLHTPMLELARTCHALPACVLTGACIHFCPTGCSCWVLIDRAPRASSGHLLPMHSKRWHPLPWHILCCSQVLQHNSVFVACDSSLGLKNHPLETWKNMFLQAPCDALKHHSSICMPT